MRFAAYIIGYEVGANLGGSMGMGSLDEVGTRRPSTECVGAAAAAARFIGSQCRADGNGPRGIAASGASGLKMNFGSMTKPLHVGHAAQWE
jgi:2-methylcitrate dehydratase PrpD